MPPVPLMPEPIRVLFDAALFARVRGGERSGSRTGVYRVVDRTVRLLAAADGVELGLGAHTQLEPTLAYVRDDPALRELRFRLARRTLAGARLHLRTLERCRVAAHPALVLPDRVLNKATAVTNRALDAAGRRFGVGPHGWAHVYHSPWDPLPAPDRRSRGVRYVLTVYDLIPQLFPDTVKAWNGDAWVRSVLGSIRPEDYVLAISEHTKRDLLDAYPAVAPERVRVTPLAADPEHFYRCEDPARIAAVRARYGVPDAPYVLAVGTLAPHKNLAHLVRTWGELVRAERLDDLHLVLVGAKGWDYGPVFDELVRLGDVASRVVFTGYVDDADLAPLYSGALAFAYPSLYEGFGLPPLEAMQCGTPVVTGNTSSLPEVVGDAGVMVDPRDRDALAQALLDLYRDPARRAELTARGLARARQFTWARYAEQTIAGYRAALASA